jgi:hypothetical protein
MADNLTRVFNVADTVYVIDWWETDYGTRFCGAEAYVLGVNKKEQNFRALLYGDSIQTYKINDYKYIIFDTLKEACEAAKKLPKPKDKVFRITSKGVTKFIITDIDGRGYTTGMELFVRLNNGEEITIDQIGKTLFLNEEEAKAHL